MKAMLHNIYNWQKDEKQQISGKNKNTDLESFLQLEVA